MAPHRSFCTIPWPSVDIVPHRSTFGEGRLGGAWANRGNSEVSFLAKTQPYNKIGLHVSVAMCISEEQSQSKDEAAIGNQTSGSRHLIHKIARARLSFVGMPWIHPVIKHALIGSQVRCASSRQVLPVLFTAPFWVIPPMRIIILSWHGS